MSIPPRDALSDLQDLIWMRHQWRRFRRLLLGAFGVVWVLCSSGLLLLRSEEDPPPWFYTRLAMMFMLVAASLFTVWLWSRASREIRSLGQQATEARLEEARHAREPRKPKRRR